MFKKKIPYPIIDETYFKGFSFGFTFLLNLSHLVFPLSFITESFEYMSSSLYCYFVTGFASGCIIEYLSTSDLTI